MYMSILVVLCMYVNGNVPTQYFGCNFGFVSDWILGGKLVVVVGLYWYNNICKVLCNTIIYTNGLYVF